VPEDGDKIRITSDETRAPKADEAAKREKLLITLPPAAEEPSPAERKKSIQAYGAIAPAQPTATPAVKGFHLTSSATCYTALAGSVGALVAWGLTEIVLPPRDIASIGLILLHSVLWLALVGAFVGAAIGCVEGVTSRALYASLRGGCLGLLMGAAGCALGAAVGQSAYFIVRGGVTGSFGFQMISRAVAWGVAGLCLGLAQGVALGAGRKVVRGLLGGLADGAVGGLLFDPVGRILGGIHEGLVSRLISLLILGAAVGGAIGLIEEMLKDAWLRVEQGVLAGKQFVIYRNPTLIGSSPKCQIYLFKDPSIEPRHAAVHIVGNHYEIEDLRSEQGTFVNQQAVSRQPLNDGDRIRIGKTIFHYSERKKGGR